MAETTKGIAFEVPSGPALRRDQPGASASQFFPLNALRDGLTASRRDLEKVRAIGAELNTKVAALSNRSQYTPAFIATETARLRQEASQTALNYLMQQQTTTRLENTARQAPHWTTPKYLARAQADTDLALEKYDTEGNAAKVARAQLAASRMTNTLLGVRMLDSEGLIALADSAAESGDWVRLSIAVNALSGRAEAGNETSRWAKLRLEQTVIPDCQEALELLEESRKISEYLDVGLRSISSGNEDSSLRVQSYIEQQNQRTAQQQEQQQREADSTARADLRRRAG